VPVVRQPGFLQRFQLRLPVHAALARFASDVPVAVHAAHGSAQFASSRSFRATFLAAASFAGMSSACPKCTSSGVRPFRSLCGRTWLCSVT